MLVYCVLGVSFRGVGTGGGGLKRCYKTCVPQVKIYERKVKKGSFINSQLSKLSAARGYKVLRKFQVEISKKVFLFISVLLLLKE